MLTVAIKYTEIVLLFCVFVEDNEQVAMDTDADSTDFHHY